MLQAYTTKEKEQAGFGFYVYGFNNADEVEDFYNKIIEAGIVKRHREPPKLRLVENTGVANAE